MTTEENKCTCRCHRGVIGKDFTKRFGYCAGCMDTHLAEKLHKTTSFLGGSVLTHERKAYE